MEIQDKYIKYTVVFFLVLILFYSVSGDEWVRSAYRLLIDDNVNMHEYNLTNVTSIDFGENARICLNSSGHLIVTANRSVIDCD